LGGQSGGERDRAAAFRARHSIGQRVRGRVLRRDASGLFWVLVGGEELLARLEVPADPGDELAFIVRALTPEIMLQALARGQAAADLPGLLQRFRAAREVFEQQDAALFAPLKALPPSPNVRVEAFQSGLDASPASQERLERVLDILGQLNAAAPSAMRMAALYEPWLLPQGRRMEAWRRGDDVALSASLPDCGDAELRFTRSGSGGRLIVLSQRPEASGRLQVEAAALIRASLGLEPEVLAARLSRPTPRGGVLGELLGDTPGWTSGGLNTRV
jgi:hypothetical protein